MRAAHQTGNGIIVQFEDQSCQGADYNQRNHRYQETVENPHISAADERLHESLTCPQTDCRQEKRYAHLAEHHVGAGRRVCDHTEIGAETGYEYRHHQRTTGKPELERLGQSGQHDGEPKNIPMNIGISLGSLSFRT